jgi:hypothetical protein
MSVLHMSVLRELQLAFRNKNIVQNVLLCLAVIIVMHLLYGVYRSSTILQEGARRRRMRRGGRRRGVSSKTNNCSKKTLRKCNNSFKKNCKKIKKTNIGKWRRACTVETMKKCLNAYNDGCDKKSNDTISNDTISNDTISNDTISNDTVCTKPKVIDDDQFGTCVCPIGFTGKDCSINEKEVCNNGIVTVGEDGTSFTCSCKEGYIKNNAGKCVCDTENGYSFGTNKGITITEGDKCFRDPCLTDACNKSNSKDNMCSSAINDGEIKYTCECDNSGGYFGHDCKTCSVDDEGGTTVYINSNKHPHQCIKDPCTAKYCNSRGTCQVDGEDNPTCKCKPGARGTYCGICDEGYHLNDWTDSNDTKHCGQPDQCIKEEKCHFPASEEGEPANKCTIEHCADVCRTSRWHKDIVSEDEKNNCVKDKNNKCTWHLDTTELFDGKEVGKCLLLPKNASTVNNQAGEVIGSGFSCNKAVYDEKDNNIAKGYILNTDNNPSTCDVRVPGCVDPDANNYDKTANIDDGECKY